MMMVIIMAYDNYLATVDIVGEQHLKVMMWTVT
jgi:hypothetical protein